MSFPDLPHLRQLQTDLWQWPKSRAAVMVGAGVSLNAEALPGVRTHFPTWKQLVRTMFDELHPLQPGDDPADRERRFSSANALRIASEYEAAFDRRKLELLIHQQIPDSLHEPGALHKRLLTLPWVDVFTTNYDTLLEKTEVPGRTYQPVVKASELTAAFAPRIVKLHGSFPAQTPLIVTEEDYRTYPRRFAPFVNSVQQSLIENSFVLVGFSGEDPNFLAWTGWIRDELGDNHAPIYLVGSLSLGNAERSLLAARGVTPIDLSPLFVGINPPNGKHAASLEWFLQSLLAARPPNPTQWPQWAERKPIPSTTLPPLDDAGVIVPPVVGLSPTEPLQGNVVEKVLDRWRFEREQYPGWIVLPEQKRSELWTKTKFWVLPLTKFVAGWSAVGRLLVFREINWRLEAVMGPSLSELVEPFENTLDELFVGILQSQSGFTFSDLTSVRLIADSEVADAWIEIAFGLLRDARENYDRTRWNRLKLKVDKVVQRYSQHSDRNHFEAALSAMWSVDRNEAKDVISRWQPSSYAPLAAMRKAALLAELDEPGEAGILLRLALLEIRRALRSQGRNIELLSLEGWCTYLLYAVESSLDLARSNAVREEFWERWQELKAWDCNPWAHTDYFHRVLSSPPPRPPLVRQEVRGFDPDRVSVSLHFTTDQLGPYLPAFAYIRLFERVGLPMRLPQFNLLGTALTSACQWIAPFVRFWSPAVLIRAGDKLINDEFLNRTQVSAMDPALAKRVYAWNLEILQRELANLTFPLASAQESLLAVLAEVLSRLTFKVDASELTKAFPVVLNLNSQPGLQSHMQLHASCEPWFRRLYEVADRDLLLEWLPDLIKSPLVDSDPMSEFPSLKGIEIDESRSNCVAKIRDATDWLLRRASSESGEGRHRAIDRLIAVFRSTLMTTEQQHAFGELLWSQTAANLPDLPGAPAYQFLYLPAPQGRDVPSILKNRMLALQWTGMVTSGARSIAVGVGTSEQPLLDTTLISKPVVHLAGELRGEVEWTPDESKQLYSKARGWWENDKPALSVGFMGADLVLSTLRGLGLFLARVVLPKMDWATEQDWQELLGWLRELRGFDSYPTLALPYVLLQRTSETEAVTETILNDLNSDTSEAVCAAAVATRHWIHLASQGLVSTPPSSLMNALIERVTFRRSAGITSCLGQLGCLIIEQPESITPSQAAHLTASLVAWNEATSLQAPGKEQAGFFEAERPGLRARVASLAGALKTWYLKYTPSEAEPAPIVLWRRLCAADPLPEIRRAFNAAIEYKP